MVYYVHSVCIIKRFATQITARAGKIHFMQLVAQITILALYVKSHSKEKLYIEQSGIFDRPGAHDTDNCL